MIASGRTRTRSALQNIQAKLATPVSSSSSTASYVSRAPLHLLDVARDDSANKIFGGPCGSPPLASKTAAPPVRTITIHRNYSSSRVSLRGSMDDGDSPGSDDSDGSSSSSSSSSSGSDESDSSESDDEVGGGDELVDDYRHTKGDFKRTRLTDPRTRHSKRQNRTEEAGYNVWDDVHGDENEPESDEEGEQDDDGRDPRAVFYSTHYNDDVPYTQLIEDDETPVVKDVFDSQGRFYRCRGKRQARGGVPNTCQIFDVKELHHNNALLLKEFLNEASRIRPRYRTGLCAKCSRKVKRVVKRARQMGLLPTITEFQVRDSGPGGVYAWADLHGSEMNADPQGAAKAAAKVMRLKQETKKEKFGSLV